ncbi:hypothetical protein [Actinomadura sp. HBU206391]|uniref:hypothetical protein n=1 Tax=Actinomadura sp. HBU206391 TaxID=2731692 RepID=UPI001650B337|nr:hypothetical protein [Actinomadura sp. HBU206391]MBC6459369.1 hypothetical protein [Actinomadura sp. HBU206391]
MRIAIVEGTGSLGGRVAEESRSRGHGVRVPSRSVPVPVPLTGRLGRALRGGALTAERPDVRGATSFATWLTAERR